MHVRFMDTFNIGETRATYAEWTDKAPNHILLTIPQWWKKIQSLKLEGQWLARITAILKGTSKEHLLKSVEFSQLGGETAKSDFILFIFAHIVDPVTFLPREFQ